MEKLSLNPPNPTRKAQQIHKNQSEKPNKPTKTYQKSPTNPQKPIRKAQQTHKNHPKPHPANPLRACFSHSSAFLLHFSAASVASSAAACRAAGTVAP